MIVEKALKYHIKVIVLKWRSIERVKKEVLKYLSVKETILKKC